MGIGPQGINVLLTLYTEGRFEGMRSVIELGSQDLQGDPDERTLAVRAATKRPEPSAGPIKTAAELYRALGFSDHQSIDADGAHGAHVFDLNSDIRAKYSFTQQFDLVTNHGTTEHCFDQFNALRNVHNLCAKGGLILHALPFQGYLNHGFFNYQPALFRDLARANGYEVLGRYLNIDDGIAHVCAYDDALMKHLTMTPVSSMGLFVVLRKTTDADFRAPFDARFLAASKLDRAAGWTAVSKLHLPLPLEDVAAEMPARIMARVLAKRIRHRVLRRLGLL